MFIYNKHKLFFYRNFLAEKQCNNIIQEMEEAKKSVAQIFSSSIDSPIVDNNFRSTKIVSVQSNNSDEVKLQLCGLFSELSLFFDIQLTKIEDLKFLQYCKGDFFKPHVDNGGAVPYIFNRNLSLIIFLNSENVPTSTTNFIGGELILHGTKLNGHFDPLGVSIPAIAGLLVVFKADILHEVSTIITGKRYTIVSWAL